MAIFTLLEYCVRIALTSRLLNLRHGSRGKGRFGAKLASLNRVLKPTVMDFRQEATLIFGLACGARN